MFTLKSPSQTKNWKKAILKLLITTILYEMPIDKNENVNARIDAKYFKSIKNERNWDYDCYLRLYYITTTNKVNFEIYSKLINKFIVNCVII